MAKEQREAERKLKEKFHNVLDQKQSEIARINQQLSVHSAQLKQSKAVNVKLSEAHKQLQHQVAMMGYDPSGSEGLKSLSPNHEMEQMKLKGKKQMVNYSGEAQKNSSKNPYLNDCFQKLQIGN